MHKEYRLEDLRKAASLLLAAAAKVTFPDTKLIGGGVTPLAFYYDFIFPFAFQAPLLALIEEEIFRLIKRKIPFSCREMIPMVAAEFLRHKGSASLVSRVLDSDASLVTLVEIEGFIDLCSEPLVCQVTQDVGVVKLKAFEVVGKKEGLDVVRIWGAADRDKQSLKNFLKIERDLVQKVHSVSGVKSKYFTLIGSEGSLWLWLPRGRALLQGVKNHLDSLLSEEGFLFVSAPSPEELSWARKEDSEEMFGLEAVRKRAAILAECGCVKVCEEVVFSNPHLDDFSFGLMKTYKSLFDLQYAFVSQGEVKAQCISSLQFIIKMLKILGFEFKIIFSARKVKASAKGVSNARLRNAVLEALENEKLVFQENLVSGSDDVAVDFFVTDALGREWRVSLMKVIHLESKGDVVITSLLGSRERAVALLIEKGNESLFLSQ